jgi:chromosome segregation ATPase
MDAVRSDRASSPSRGLDLTRPSGSEDLSGVLAELDDKLGGYAAELAHLTQELESRDRTIARQQEALQSHRSESTLLKEAFASSEALAAELSEGIEVLRADKTQLQQVLNDRSAAMSDLEQRLHDQLTLIEELRRSESSTAFELEAASLERASLAVVAQQDATRMDELQQALIRYRTFGETQARLEAEIERLNLEISAGRNQSLLEISEITAEVSSLKTRLRERDEQLTEVERQLDEKTIEVRELCDRLTETTLECDQLRAELTSQNASVQALLEEVTECRTNILDMKDEQTRQLELQAQTEEQLRTYQNELPKIQKRILGLRHGGLNRQFVALADELGRLLGEHSTEPDGDDEGVIDQLGETVPIDVANSALAYGQEQRMRVHRVFIVLLAGLALIYFAKPL